MRHTRKLVAALIVALMTMVIVPSSLASTYPNDPLYPGQWGLQRTSSVASWKYSTGKDIVIADIDTGITPGQEFAGKLVPGAHDFVTNGFPTDYEGHGTYTASIEAANTNNGTGVAGEAPSAKILALGVFGHGAKATGHAETSAILYAVAHGAKVINMSLGADFKGVPIPVDPTGLADAAVEYAVANGVTVVASAGNEATPFCASPSFGPGVICVGASDEFDRLASFSNYGARLDVVAPGTDIWGAWRRSGSYVRAFGTSASAPFVSGLAAQLMAMGANNVLAGLIIRYTAKDLGLPGYDITYGFGRIDALKAVQLCAKIC